MFFDFASVGSFRSLECFTTWILLKWKQHFAELLKQVSLDLKPPKKRKETYY